MTVVYFVKFPLLISIKSTIFKIIHEEHLVSSRWVDRGHLSRDVTIFNEATGKKIFEIFQHARKPLLHNSRETFRSGAAYEVLWCGLWMGENFRNWDISTRSLWLGHDDNPLFVKFAYFDTNRLNVFFHFFHRIYFFEIYKFFVYI